MLGLNNKAALPSPPVVEETTSNSMNRVLEMKNQDIPKKGVLVEKAPLMATLLQKRGLECMQGNQGKEFSRPPALDKNWENLKNRFKSPNAIDNIEVQQPVPKKWMSQDLRYIPERSQSVIAEGDARKIKKVKSKVQNRRLDMLGSSQKSDKDSISVSQPANFKMSILTLIYHLNV